MALRFFPALWIRDGSGQWKPDTLLKKPAGEEYYSEYAWINGEGLQNHASHVADAHIVPGNLPTSLTLDVGEDDT